MLKVLMFFAAVTLVGVLSACGNGNSNDIASTDGLEAPAVSSGSDQDAGSGDTEGGDDPLAPVAFFFYYLEFFDRDAMLEQVCPEIRDDTDAALALLQSLAVVGGAVQLDVSDFEADVTSVEGDRAFVQISARIGGGFLGSAPLDEMIEVRREGGSWCMTDSDFLNNQ